MAGRSSGPSLRFGVFPERVRAKYASPVAGRGAPGVEVFRARRAHGSALLAGRGRERDCRGHALLFAHGSNPGLLGGLQAPDEAHVLALQLAQRPDLGRHRTSRPRTTLCLRAASSGIRGRPAATTRPEEALERSELLTKIADLLLAAPQRFLHLRPAYRSPGHERTQYIVRFLGGQFPHLHPPQFRGAGVYNTERARRPRLLDTTPSSLAPSRDRFLFLCRRLLLWLRARQESLHDLGPDCLAFRH